VIAVGIITVSDRASSGQYADLAGPALAAAVREYGWEVVAEVLVPDEKEAIASAILAVISQGAGLVLTTGGTGIAERDVTPEAIRGIMRTEIPGFGEVMRAASMPITPNALLSRGLGAVVEGAIVLALPGKPSGAVECLGFVAGALPHAVKLARREPTSC